MTTQNPITRPLKIYRASAGSGKTFTLAVEYIKLLIENPLEYMNILAVTFTNKATAEMKNRILSQLYGLSKGLASSNDYFKKIKEEPRFAKYSDDNIRQRAGMALQNIVHDYSRFRIETIDSFFQSVLRDLAHELKLSANLRVDLNDDEVLYKAVENIINNLEPIAHSSIGFSISSVKRLTRRRTGLSKTTSLLSVRTFSTRLFLRIARNWKTPSPTAKR